MPGTTIYANWTGVKFTPASAAAIPITRVSNVEFDPGGTLTPYSGDGNRYPVGQFPLMNNPRATVQSENIGVLATLVPGMTGSFEAVLNDAKNLDAAAGGALKFTLANAVVQNGPISGRHAQFATGQVNFGAFSTDGTTAPLSVTTV